MASGHGYRTQRPNTWLLRPMLQREDSSCQPGAVHTWPLADVAVVSANVRFQGKSGRGQGAARLPLMTQSGHERAFPVLA